jgi:uncharacterized protein YlxW (UPF0749 family)
MSRRLPPRRRLSRSSWALSIAGGLAAIGFIGAAQWNSSFARQEFVTSAQSILIREAEQLQARQETLRAEIEAADARVQELQEADAGSQVAIRRLNDDLLAASVASDIASVRGPGVVIEIADALQPLPEGDTGRNYVLVDDLRDIVNALWASGAEGIAVSGGLAPGVLAERIVATTAIDGAGSAILVNSARLSPPIRIEAIGPEGLHDRFITNPIFLVRVGARIDAYGLQFASEPRDEVILPRFIGNTSMRWGAPAPEER